MHWFVLKHIIGPCHKFLTFMNWTINKNNVGEKKTWEQCIGLCLMTYTVPNAVRGARGKKIWKKQHLLLHSKVLFIWLACERPLSVYITTLQHSVHLKYISACRYAIKTHSCWCIYSLKIQWLNEKRFAHSTYSARIYLAQFWKVVKQKILESHSILLTE